MRPRAPAEEPWGPQASANPTLPNRRTIAYLTSVYPRATDTFIRTEVDPVTEEFFQTEARSPDQALRLLRRGARGALAEQIALRDALHHGVDPGGLAERQTLVARLHRHRKRAAPRSRHDRL